MLRPLFPAHIAAAANAFRAIAADIYCGRGMDPVDLYQCGDQDYVLHRHHRVAVARPLRQRSVLANITQVRRRSRQQAWAPGPGCGAPPAADELLQV